MNYALDAMGKAAIAVETTAICRKQRQTYSLQKMIAIIKGNVMKEWTGKVTLVRSVPYQSVILYQFKIDQSERFFRLGKIEPTFEEGAWIKFTERNGQVDPSSVETGVKEVPSDSVTGSPQKEDGSPTSTAVDVGRRLRYQSARADAARIVTAALAADHLPHSANTAKGKRLDLLLNYVNEVTDTLLKMEDDNA